MAEDNGAAGAHGEHSKPCRSCFKFQEWMQLRMGRGKEDKSTEEKEGEKVRHGLRTDCPLDKDQLGTSTWGLLHTMAAQYPEKPTVDDQKGIENFLKLLGRFYPCDYCAADLRKDLEKQPPITDNRVSLSQWMCRLHNMVNERTGKPLFDCTTVDQRWKDGWNDGSCG